MPPGGCYEILLNYACNARCFFCSQDFSARSVDSDFEKIAADIRRGYKLGYRKLGLTGGEPLIRPDIVKIVEYAKKTGFPYVRIQTNGIRLSDEKLAGKLAKAGLTYARISVHGHNAKIHDFLVGVPGAFNGILKGIESLQKRKIRIGLNLVVNKLNYKFIPDFYDFFVKKEVSDFIFIYPLHIGAMKLNRKVLSVPISKAVPYVYEAFKAAEKYGLGVYPLLLNFPPCLLPDLAPNIIALDRLNTVVLDPSGGSRDLDEYRDYLKIKKSFCRRCLYFKKCPGIDSGYSEIWGFKEFKPILKLPVKPEEDFSAREESAKIPEFLTDNQKCLIEILKRENNITTARVLKIAEKIPLCKDCADGNAVLNASQSLVKHGLVERKFKNGKYYWNIVAGSKFFNPGKYEN